MHYIAGMQGILIGWQQIPPEIAHIIEATGAKNAALHVKILPLNAFA
jgi:hypothetical protein